MWAWRLWGEISERWAELHVCTNDISVIKWENFIDIAAYRTHSLAQSTLNGMKIRWARKFSRLLLFFYCCSPIDYWIALSAKRNLRKLPAHELISIDDWIGSRLCPFSTKERIRVTYINKVCELTIIQWHELTISSIIISGTSGTFFLLAKKKIKKYQQKPSTSSMNGKMENLFI